VTYFAAVCVCVCVCVRVCVEVTTCVCHLHCSAFGILKGRFKILKVANQFQSLEKVDNLFRACCLLHNWLLDFDGRSAWSEGVDYSEGGRESWFSNSDVPALERRFSSLRAMSSEDGLKLITRDLDLSSIGRRPGTATATGAASEVETAAHYQLAQCLASHYHFAHPPQ